MREPKFRAWDKIEKRLRLVLAIEFDKAIYLDNPKEFRLIDTIELMRHAGFKDKNGKEIYNGDIVKAPDSRAKEFYDGDNEKIDFNCLVVEIQPPRLWIKGERCGHEGEMFISPFDCEIIGNIYQNPELLKENKNVSKI